MRELKNIIDSKQFQQAWNESSMEYDFIERIATVCAKDANHSADKKN